MKCSLLASRNKQLFSSVSSLLGAVDGSLISLPRESIVVLCCIKADDDKLAQRVITTKARY